MEIQHNFYFVFARKAGLNEHKKISTPIKQFSEDDFQKWVNEQKAKLQ